MDFSKAVDTINHELLNAHGFSKPSLRLIYNYLKGRLQHIRISLAFSEWSEIIQGVPQGSVLGLWTTFV